MLKGTLDDFSLPDIFRLLSYAKKTGRLDVRRRAGEGEVFFRDGEVYFAQSSLSRDPLGQRLIRAGALTEGQLRKALDENAATGRRVGEILVESGVASSEQIEAMVRNQIEDAAFDLLRWELGEFSWEPDVNAEVEIQLGVSVENLIVEASRRLDELEVIKRKIPSADSVLRMAPKPPEGAVEINITPEEWRVLVLVDGTRTISEIGELGGMDELQAMRTFYGLVSAGLVEVEPGVGGEGETPAAALPEEEAEEVAAPEAPARVEAPEKPVEVAPPPEAAKRAEEVATTREPAKVEAPAEPVGAMEEPAGPGTEEEEEWLEEAGVSVDQFDAPEPYELSTEIPTEEKGDEDTFLAELLDEDLDAAEPSAAPEHALEGQAEVIEEEAAQNSPSSSTGGPQPSGAPAKKVEVDRASVVRELAGLFSEEEGPRPRSAPSGRRRQPSAEPSREQKGQEGQEGQEGQAGEEREDDRKRVEDDDQISKGLISRLIDGVKGL